MCRLCVDYGLVKSLLKMDALPQLDYGLIKSLSKMIEMTDAEKTEDVSRKWACPNTNPQTSIPIATPH